MRYLIALLLVLAIGLGIWFYPAKTLLPTSQQADDVRYQAHATQAKKFDDAGNLTHVINAKDLLHFTDGHSRLANVKLTLYPANQPPVTVYANEAFADEEGKLITLQGKVRITQQYKPNVTREFSTERVVYDVDKQQATTALFVTLLQTGAKLSGQGMKLDLRKKKLRLDAKVVAQLSNPGKPDIIVQADNALMLEHDVWFHGNVLMQQTDSKMRADTLHVITDTQHQAQQIIAQGKPVRYQGWPKPKQPQVIATAQQMQYFVAKQWVTLSGNSHVEQGKNQFSAPTIDYDVKAQHVITKEKGPTRTIIKLFPESDSGYS